MSSLFAMLVSWIIEVISMTKRINRLPKGLHDAVRTIMKAVEQINALSENETVLGGISLEAIKLPTWVKPFLVGRRIAFDAPHYFKDLVDRPQPDAAYKPDVQALIKSANVVASCFRAVATLETASKLRPEVQLVAQVPWAIQMDDGKWYMRCQDFVPVVPVPLRVKGMDVVEDYALTDEAAIVLKNYVFQSLQFTNK